MEISLVDWQEVEKAAAKEAAHVARQNAKTEHIKLYRDHYWCLTSEGSRQGVPKRDWARVTKEEARQRPPPDRLSAAAAEWWEWYTGLLWQGQAKEQQAAYSAAAKSWREKCGGKEGKTGYNELRVARRSAARRGMSGPPSSYPPPAQPQRSSAERASERRAASDLLAAQAVQPCEHETGSSTIATHERSSMLVPPSLLSAPPQAFAPSRPPPGMLPQSLPFNPAAGVGMQLAPSAASLAPALMRAPQPQYRSAQMAMNDLGARPPPPSELDISASLGPLAQGLEALLPPTVAMAMSLQKAGLTYGSQNAAGFGQGGLAGCEGQGPIISPLCAASQVLEGPGGAAQAIPHTFPACMPSCAAQRCLAQQAYDARAVQQACAAQLRVRASSASACSAQMGAAQPCGVSVTSAMSQAMAQALHNASLLRSMSVRRRRHGPLAPRHPASRSLLSILRGGTHVFPA